MMKQMCSEEKVSVMRGLRQPHSGRGLKKKKRKVTMGSSHADSDVTMVAYK